MEFLIGRVAVINHREFIMNDNVFQEGLGPLRRAINEVLRLAYPPLTKQDASRMAEHLRGLNVTTFRRRLREAANEFGVELHQDDVEAIAATRNELGHRAGFVTDEPFKEFQRVQSVVDRLLLGLLGYRGPHIDVIRLERATRGNAARS